MTRTARASRSVGMSRKANAPIELSGNPGQLIATLQSLTLALRIGGLDGLRSGAVKIGERQG